MLQQDILSENAFSSKSSYASYLSNLTFLVCYVAIVQAYFWQILQTYFINAEPCIYECQNSAENIPAR